MFELLTSLSCRIDTYLRDLFSHSEYGSHLMSTSLGLRITQVLFLAFIAVLSYETIYHTGIYLHLWEHHAKHIFKEIPVHCAHVYIDVNFASADSIRENRLACASHKSKPNHLIKAMHKASAFKFPGMVRYHLEFSPDDFENNMDPDLGSTIGHLREKILKLAQGSEYFSTVIGNLNELTTEAVCIFDRKNNEIPPEKNDAYLVHCNIETGNKVTCIIVA